MSDRPSPFVIEARAALISERLEVTPDARIVVENRTVASAGARGSAAAPHGVEVVDAGDLLVVPGVVDAHVHIGLADAHDVLVGGVTSVRDLGWPPDQIAPLIAGSMRSGFDGPLVTAAGQMLTAPGGYPAHAPWAPSGTARAVEDPHDAERAVAEQVELGASIIKIALNPPVGPVLDPPTLHAIVDAAHAIGLEVTAHVYGLDQLRSALAAGVDELAHMLMSPEVIPDDVIDAMVQANMVVVPTLSIRHDDQALAIDNTRRFREAGGCVVYGTDLGNEGPEAGIDRREIDALARAGMSAHDIMRSATVDAARRLGLSSKGVIAPGMDADLVALPISAIEDPAALTDVQMVWREGRRAR